MNYYLKCLKQYADFKSRARRSEYWFFTLFNIIIAVAVMFVATILGNMALNMAGLGIIVYYVYCLATFIPGLAVGVRRLHDIGKSGLVYLIVLIPFIGALILLVLFCRDSQPGENQWGVNPKQ